MRGKDKAIYAVNLTFVFFLYQKNFVSFSSVTLQWALGARSLKKRESLSQSVFVQSLVQGKKKKANLIASYLQM